MSQTTKGRQLKAASVMKKMKKSHSFGATADLGLSFSRLRRPRTKKHVKAKSPNQLQLPDTDNFSSRTASDDAASVDSSYDFGKLTTSHSFSGVSAVIFFWFATAKILFTLIYRVKVCYERPKSDI